MELARDETISGKIVEGNPDEIYDKLVKAGREVMSQTGWMLGDLALQVERVFTESVLKDYARDIGVSPQTIYNARTIARAFPEASRPDTLLFGVAKVLAAQQDRLTLVERRPGMNVAEARNLVKARQEPSVQNASKDQPEPDAIVDVFRPARRALRETFDKIPDDAWDDFADWLDDQANKARKRAKAHRSQA